MRLKPKQNTSIEIVGLRSFIPLFSKSSQSKEKKSVLEMRFAVLKDRVQRQRPATATTTKHELELWLVTSLTIVGRNILPYTIKYMYIVHELTDWLAE